MTTFTTMSTSSAPSISDLDGFSFGRDNMFNMSNTSYAPADHDDFGFDPPTSKAAYSKVDNMYSPPDLTGWPGFERDDELQDTKQNMGQPYEIDRMIAQTLPTATAISRYGQITPPRTNSNTPDESVGHQDPARASGRKRIKTQQSDTSAVPPKATSGRKRKNAKKNAAAEPADSPEDAKRRASLEKNRLAAAKCRVNKKEKTEQLQRDSHEKGLHNQFLKEQVMRMKSEVQHMQTILLSHANCEGCKSPEEIQKHLATLGQEYMNNQMLNTSFADYQQMDGLPQEPLVDDYFSASMSPENPAMLHPPLPEFDRNVDFEGLTPMRE